MIKKGIVMEIHKNKVGILTSSGEFVYVKNLTPSLSIGEIYESEEVPGKSLIYKNFKKLSLVAASFLIVFLCSTFIRIYNLPVSAVTIDINPSIKLEANKWNRIIKITPLNDDGTHIISNLNLKNKSLENGITLILNESEKEHYINDNYKNGSKSISLNFKGDTDNLNLDNIEKELKNLKVKYNITTSKGNKTNSSEHKKLKNNKENIKGNSKENNKENNNKNNNFNNNAKSKDIEPKSKATEPNKKNNNSINKDSSSKKKNNNSSNENKTNIKSSKNNKNNESQEKHNNNQSNNSSKNTKDTNNTKDATNAKNKKDSVTKQ